MRESDVTDGMATATCENENCDKGEWRLQKHPSQYARGVTCPECGTSRVDIDVPEPEQTQGAQEVATQEPQRSQNLPATGEHLPSDEDALQVGMQAGSILAGLNSEDPAEKATATGRGLKAAGSMLAQFGDWQERKGQADAQRAMDASNDDISVAQDYPQCPDCGERLTNLPEPGQMFRCPKCGTPLEYDPN